MRSRHGANWRVGNNSYDIYGETAMRQRVRAKLSHSHARWLDGLRRVATELAGEEDGPKSIRCRVRDILSVRRVSDACP